MSAALPILTFHALDPLPTPVAVDSGLFRRLLARFGAEGRRSAPLDAVVRFVQDGTPPPPFSLLLTFDDGYASVRDAAAAAKEAGFGVVLFLAPSLMGRPVIFPGEAICPPQPSLTWDEARALAAAGVEIGSHAYDHVDLRRLDDGALDDALARSRAELEDRLGVAVRTLAYPFGYVDDRVARAAARRYDAAFTTRLDWCRAGGDPYRIPRLDAWYLRGLADGGSLDARSTRAYVAFRRIGRAVRSRVLGGPA